MTSPRPGWYQDPENPDQQKWWDGQYWSTYTLPLAGAESPASGGSEAANSAGEVSADGAPHDRAASVGQNLDSPFTPVHQSPVQQTAAYQTPAQQAPGGREQARPASSDNPVPQSPGTAGPDGHAGYPGYQQGYGGPAPAYGGYPGYPGYPGHQAYPGYLQGPAGTNAMALTGFILGLVSLFLFWIPLVGTAVALGAGIFSAVGLARQGKRAPVYKVLGIIGLILGIIFLLLSVLIAVAVLTPSYY
ncbi:DUF2510 domain-containing protein [Arthrobacter sp. ATA002]|uniref:DUF2510 domain-containing protein n=1 Tax=Arthrobacter sp. ATA002 TaxID=2991715 RepID=UPI0022A75B89|nr:DUF2510 domain-containing protein [Arthrobacter sp. ATA002]WAP50909.1 DUF2510 domain-containing protein [Arthrobacter sp. ATA002]